MTALRPVSRGSKSRQTGIIVVPAWRRHVHSQSTRPTTTIAVFEITTLRVVSRCPVTSDVLEDIANHVRSFRTVGGSVRRPPHSRPDRQRWAAQARSLIEDYHVHLGDRRDDTLEIGLLYMWYALRRPRCMAAIVAGEVVASLSFGVLPDSVYVGYLGSRRASRVAGAAMALQLELAREAVRRRVGVTSSYVAKSRTFHERIGRRLGHPEPNTSRWTFEDCCTIVSGVDAMLGGVQQ